MLPPLPRGFHVDAAGYRAVTAADAFVLGARRARTGTAASSKQYKELRAQLTDQQKQLKDTREALDMTAVGMIMHAVVVSKLVYAGKPVAQTPARWPH